MNQTNTTNTTKPTIPTSNNNVGTDVGIVGMNQTNTTNTTKPTIPTSNNNVGTDVGNGIIANDDVSRAKRIDATDRVITHLAQNFGNDAPPDYKNSIYDFSTPTNGATTPKTAKRAKEATEPKSIPLQF
jgi:hypothetical protein